MKNKFFTSKHCIMRKKQRRNGKIIRKITEKFVKKFREYLYEEEKSNATASKYICDLNKLKKYADGQELNKKLIVSYKEHLQNMGCYKPGSINSFLASANCFFQFMGWNDLKIKTIKVQKKTFMPNNRDLSKEEYKKLVDAAEKSGKIQLAYGWFNYIRFYEIDNFCKEFIPYMEQKCINVLHLMANQYL